jgi:hypothetical protein
MLLAMSFRHQARVCARLADECEDSGLADRFRCMAANLAAKAEDLEDMRTLRTLPKQPAAA